jgi:hypothetical protein
MSKTLGHGMVSFENCHWNYNKSVQAVFNNVSNKYDIYIKSNNVPKIWLLISADPLIYT